MLVVWLKKTDFNTKVTEIEGKIPSITGLATNSELTAIENKTPNAVNHFGIRKKKIKHGNKNRRQPKKCCFCNAVLQRLGIHILKKHPEHHPQKNSMSTKQEYYQRLKDAEVHDLSKYVFSSNISPERQKTIKKDAMFSELPEKMTIMPQSAFINDPMLSKSSLKENTKIDQITIRNDTMFTE